jgi:hypothetical protein
MNNTTRIISQWTMQEIYRFACIYMYIVNLACVHLYICIYLHAMCTFNTVLFHRHIKLSIESSMKLSSFTMSGLFCAIQDAYDGIV